MSETKELVQPIILEDETAGPLADQVFRLQSKLNKESASRLVLQEELDRTKSLLDYSWLNLERVKKETEELRKEIALLKKERGSGTENTTALPLVARQEAKHNDTAQHDVLKQRILREYALSSEYERITFPKINITLSPFCTAQSPWNRIRRAQQLTRKKDAPELLVVSSEFVPTADDFKDGYMFKPIDMLKLPWNANSKDVKLVPAKRDYAFVTIDL